MSNDLHARVLAVAKRMEAADAAAELLREHEGFSMGDIADGGTLPDKIAAAREELGLDRAAHDDDVAEGLDDIDPDEAFLDAPLALEVQGAFRDGAWQVTGVEVTVCTGGPHIEIVYDGGSMRLNGYWGGERVEGMPVSSSRAEQLLDEAMEVQA